MIHKPSPSPRKKTLNAEVTGGLSPLLVESCVTTVPRPVTAGAPIMTVAPGETISYGN